MLDAATKASEMAMVKPPQDQEVCFSPDDPCDAKLVKLVASAQKSIDMAIYDINLVELVHALLVQTKKIQVRIIVDRLQARGSHSLVPLLVKGGAAVKIGKQRGIMHNKFTIADEKIAETGSFNYTVHAATANNENQIYLSNPKVVERYRARFEELWGKASPVPSP